MKETTESHIKKASKDAVFLNEKERAKERQSPPKTLLLERIHSFPRI
jgi:hypothetical protein